MILEEWYEPLLLAFSDEVLLPPLLPTLLVLLMAAMLVVTRVMLTPLSLWFVAASPLVVAPLHLPLLPLLSLLPLTVLLLLIQLPKPAPPIPVPVLQAEADGRGVEPLFRLVMVNEWLCVCGADGL